MTALEILQSRQRIDLLVTDVGLPGLNGRQLADAAARVRPGPEGAVHDRLCRERRHRRRLPGAGHGDDHQALRHKDYEHHIKRTSWRPRGERQSVHYKPPSRRSEGLKVFDGGAGVEEQPAGPSVLSSPARRTTSSTPGLSPTSQTSRRARPSAFRPRSSIWRAEYLECPARRLRSSATTRGLCRAHEGRDPVGHVWALTKKSRPSGPHDQQALEGLVVGMLRESGRRNIAPRLRPMTETRGWSPSGSPGR